MTTSRGTSEAEYIALSEVVEEVLGVRQEVQNLMELSMRVLHHCRAGPKHIDTIYDLVRDACDTEEVRVVVNAISHIQCIC